jgi:predicted sulfurtransferase
LAFYRFVRLEDPFEYRRLLREYCAGKPFRGTLLLSPEGLNGMLSGEEPTLRAFQAHLASFEPFAGLEYKESRSSAIAFPRMLVKVKKEIIPLGLPHLDPARRTGARLKPLELKTWLDEGRDFVLLDTRNDYEVDYGTFENAVSLRLENFRDFPKHLQQVPAEARDKPVVMFCTGGIRCEKATAVAMEMGFREVYQLDGGILKYFEECGGAHYQGQCFVFDRRIAVDTDLSEILPTQNICND